MKTKIKALTVLLLTALLALLLAGCSGDFNAKGNAEINITLDKTYEGLSVSCPGGEITGGGAAYSIKLKTRAAVDVVVACDGYHTEYLYFSTADLSKGTAAKSISLKERDITVTFSLENVSDTSDVTFKSANGLMTGDPVKNSDGSFTLVMSEVSDDVITVAKTGYVSNKINISAEGFYDYAQSFTVPLVTEASNRAAITLTGTGNNAISINRFGYSDALRVSLVYMNGGTAKTVYLSRDGDYQIGNIIIAAKILKENPYYLIDVSSLDGNQISSNVTVSGLPNAGNLVSNTSISLRIAVNGKILNGYYNGILYLENLNEGLLKGNNDLTVLLYSNGTYTFTGGEKIYALYNTTMTNAEIRAGIDIKNEVDKTLTSTVSFIDEEGAPFIKYEISGNYADTLSYDAGEGKAEIKLYDFFSNDYNASFSSSEMIVGRNLTKYSGYGGSVEFFIGDPIVTVYENVNVKLRFIDTDGNYVDDIMTGLAHVDHFYDFDYIYTNSSVENRELNGYVNINSLPVRKNVFSYDDVGNFWYYDMPVYREKKLNVILPESLNKNAFSLNIYGNNGYGKIPREDQDGNYYIDFNETEYGSYNVSINERSGMNVTASYSGVITVTKNNFDSGTLDLSKLTRYSNYYN